MPTSPPAKNESPSVGFFSLDFKFFEKLVWAIAPEFRILFFILSLNGFMFWYRDFSRPNIIVL